MSNTEQKHSGNIASWIVGITGILVVVPALINAGADVYASVANLPKSDAEKINLEMFEEHFGKNPLHRGEIPVKTSTGTMSMELEVHTGGDILIRYGNSSQWFRSPVKEIGATFSLVGTAFAQTSTANSNGNFYQHDTLKGGQILRERFYSNGEKKTFVIDRKTGIWSELEVAGSPPRPAPRNLVVPTFKYPQIDVTK